jgi:NO-binding membrane sensor protein with MHYT domain
MDRRKSSVNIQVIVLNVSDEGKAMEILVLISFGIALFVVWKIPTFWVGLLLSPSLSFVLWVGFGAIAMHPIVTWREHFVSGSLSLSIAAYLAVWAAKKLIERRRKTKA